MRTRLAAARRWFSFQVGRRGACLLVFSFIDVVIAYSLLDPEIRAQVARIPTYRAATEVMPLAAWGWVWFAVAALCLIHSFRLRDSIGFMAAISIKLVWSGGFLVSWLWYGADRGWLSASVWGVMAALVYLISGWPEPPGPAYRLVRAGADDP